LDLVIGGLTSTNANAMEATLTHPFHTSQLVVGIPVGATFDDIAGVEVAVERNSEAAALLRKTDAVPVYVDDLGEVEGEAAAVDDWLLEDLQLQDSGVRLSESDHVMAIRPGENGWLVTLELFLLEDPTLIEELLAEDTP
jgi:ABC-type amino acid transport substrate-binding protein